MFSRSVWFADPTKVIWKTLQDLRLKANRSKWSVHHDAQEKFIKEPKLCLVAKGLNPDHQDPAEIKIALLKFGSSLGMLSTTTILINFYLLNITLLWSSISSFIPIEVGLSPLINRVTEEYWIKARQVKEVSIIVSTINKEA
ncbi:hypothetical protein YC2023_106273 [Brassica napus]